MRTKTEHLSTLEPHSYYWDKFSKNKDGTWKSNPFFSGGPYGGAKGRSQWQEITYDDTKRSGKLRTTRACDHSKFRKVIRPYDTVFGLNSGYTQKGEYRPYGSDDYGTFSISVPDLTSANAEALEFFKAGCVSQEVSLLNNVWEFKEIARLAKPLGDNIKSFGVKNVANAHLWYAFGVKPLVNDVVNLVNVLKGLKNRLTWLRKNQGKPVKVKFSKDLSTSVRPANTTSTWNVGETSYVYKDCRCKYTAYALITYDVSQLSDLEIQARILLHSFGVDKPLTVLWEAMPYSFVLDWFVRLGDWINRLQPAITFPVSFLDVGHYVKIEGFRFVYDTFYWPIRGDAKVLVQEDHYSMFHRRAGLPVSFSSLDLGDPGISQLALGISLFLQKSKMKSSTLLKSQHFNQLGVLPCHSHLH